VARVPGGAARIRPHLRDRRAAGPQRELDLFLEEVQSELRSLPRSRGEREVVQGAFRSLYPLGPIGSRSDARAPRSAAGRRFSGIGTELGRRARRLAFPATVTDIIQASRNAWTRAVCKSCWARDAADALDLRLQHALPGHGQLYGHPAVGREAKLGFSQRFGQRLAGHAVAAANDRETNIWRLVALIEEEHRARPAGSFHELLGIHHAQQASRA